MKPWIPVLALLMVGLAGCSDAPAPEDGPSGTMTDDEKTSSLDVPTWRVGDWWQYTSGFGDWTLVVGEDRGSDWFIDTDSADLSFFSAEFGEISYLGKTSKADLSGSQETGPVKFFDWPLEHGKQWTTTWDGQTFTMEAHDMGNEAFHITASQDGTVINQYRYSNRTGWFDWMSWGNPDGTEYGRMELVDSGRGYTGELVRITPELVDQKEYNGVTEQGSTVYTTIEGDDADMYLIYSAACTQGSFTFLLGTAESISNAAADAGVFEDQGFSEVGVQCPHTNAVQGAIGYKPTNGDHWGHAEASASPDLALSFSLYLRHYERITL